MHITAMLCSSPLRCLCLGIRLQCACMHMHQALQPTLNPAVVCYHMRKRDTDTDTDITSVHERIVASALS